MGRVLVKTAQGEPKQSKGFVLPRPEKKSWKVRARVPGLRRL